MPATNATLCVNATVADTRATTDAAYKTSFETGDAIGLFAVLRSDAAVQAYPGAAGNYIQNAKFVRQDDGSWKEEGSKSYAPADGQVLDVYAYYPYVENADPTALKYDASEQSVDLMTARTIRVEAPFEEISLTFHHKLVLVEGCIAGDDRLTQRDVTLNNVRVAASFSLAAASQAQELVAVEEKTGDVKAFRNGIAYHAYLPAQSIAKGTKLYTLGGAAGSFDYEAPRDAQLQSGAVKKFLIAPLPDDASIEPNSYVIAPGDVLYIPVAKMVDVWASNAVLASTSTNVLAGEMEAEIVWNDNRFMLTDDQLAIVGKGRDAVIQVRTDSALGEGNALVAVRVGGEIRWSWHVWVTDYDPNDPAVQKTFNGNTFMDRNIGAFSSAVGDPLSMGLQFQWGRKDPIPTPAQWGDTAGKPLWDGNNKSVGFDSKVVVADVATNLVNSIASPTSIIQANSSPYDWYTLESEGDDIGDDRWDDAGAKTAFDPCPRGWRVPVSEPFKSAWEGCSAPTGTWNIGFIWQSLDTGYWPAVGYRTSTGSWDYNGVIGYYWAACPIHEEGTARKESAGSGFYFESGMTLDGYTQYRTTVMSLRCVKE